MKIQCDVCEKQEASVFCAADEAALCEGCDYRVHQANKLATKHLRFSLLHPCFKEAPLCDICQMLLIGFYMQERRAFLFCKEDRAILCRECDIPIHKANEHTQCHNRYLLTGVKISASSATYPITSPKSSTSSGPNSESHTKSSVTISSSYDHDMFNQQHSYNTSTTTPSTTTIYDQINEEGISEYLMETLPGWKVEDFLDSSSASHHFYF
ncbi:B-box zinc finger protein 20 isoform X1 [Spinacia oleracea]|uniref:B-box zinc finger protein 20 isoform X1 n=1 Tax=Spinacia oleracea TaxID=3562 RepID=A0ABM3QIH7_SPIOL|nr:B-box zinc finger protein 20 isoform X1 [Spinacia oleracea]